jgi:CheY-like chemotaxis protein
MATIDRATVLVVDDEPTVRATLASSLADGGFVVLTAEDSYDAIRVLTEHPEIDLLLTDLVMPHSTNGFDLARQAKLMRPLLKVMYITAFAETEETDRGPKYGDVVRKPFRQDRLVRDIWRTLTADGV